MNKFTGFTEEDFEIFDEPNLDKRKEKIESKIILKLKCLAQEILEHKPEEWKNFHQHFPKIERWTKHLPTTCFLAFTWKEGKEYLPYAQLNVGLCKRDGVRIRLGFIIKKSKKEEYDIHKFVKYANEHESMIKDIISRNSLTCFFSKKLQSVFEGMEQRYKWKDNVGFCKALTELKNGQHRWEWFEIGKQYGKDSEVVKSPKLVGEAIRIFESLYCVYNDINGMK